MAPWVRDLHQDPGHKRHRVGGSTYAIELLKDAGVDIDDAGAPGSHHQEMNRTTEKLKIVVAYRY